MSQSFQTRIAEIAASAAARLELEESLGCAFLPRVAPGELVARTQPCPITPSLPAAPVITRAIPSGPAAGSAASASARARETEAGKPASSAAANAQRPAPVASRPAPGPTPLSPGAIRQPALSGPAEKLSEAAPLCAGVQTCSRCPLCGHRRQAIFGDGDLNSDLLFIVNAPSRTDDETGMPFSGNDGEFFTTILEKGLKRPRNSVFLTSAVKCRPELSRDPRPEEYQACLPHLQQQLRLIRPKAMVVFGAPATHALCGGNESMAQLRGLWLEFQGIPLLPVYEISEVYRHRRNLGRNNAFERQFWLDLQTVLPRLK